MEIYKKIKKLKKQKNISDFNKLQTITGIGPSKA